VAYPYESSVDVVAADASPVKEGVRAVGAQVDLDLRHDEVRPHRALRDLRLERPAGRAIVVSGLTPVKVWATLTRCRPSHTRSKSRRSGHLMCHQIGQLNSLSTAGVRLQQNRGEHLAGSRQIEDGKTQETQAVFVAGGHPISV
jgi:hypothetical protein